MRLLSPWEFDIYALSLSRGHGFGDQRPVGAWLTEDALTCGVITQYASDASFGVLVMRRRVDHVWTVTSQRNGFQSKGKAFAHMKSLMREGEPQESIPVGIAPRPPLHDLQARVPGDLFDLLLAPSHHPAAWILNQLYLAMPEPDKNWASDCQTNNFHTRMWEAQLLAAFREQGLLVTQPYESPDFRIENRRGGAAWVEAVTANPVVQYKHVNADRSAMPTAPEELSFGTTALRFAKTLGNKIARRYHELPHVAGQPFMLAIADFQAPGSMIWSREGLIGYLYGEGAQEVVVEGQRKAILTSATHLLGDTGFQAGLFRNGRHPELSAVIFSNACSIAKLNRVAVSGCGAPQGLRYMRIGKFFDRTPGALDGIPFCLDITTDDYRNLWPQKYEPWSAEMEVFHNPFTRHPVPFELLPEATHWFEKDGERLCNSYYETSVLWSQTIIQNVSDPVIRLDDLLRTNKP